MRKNSIQEFPTTNIIIDDNKDYLRGVSTMLPLGSIIPKFFCDPKKALTHINSIPSPQNFLNFDLESSDCPQRFDINTMMLQKSLSNECRFSEISAVIVDYDMPGISGIDLCRSIKNPNIQKILLTGYLRDKEAVHALNKGWIDTFIPKGDESSKNISELITDGCRNYFFQKNRTIESFLNISSYLSSYLPKEAFDIFDKVYDAFDAVEFHLLNFSGDYLMANALGATFGLSFQSNKRIQENIELAKEMELPSQIIKDLEQRKKLFCYLESEPLPAPKNWENYLFEAKKIECMQDNFYACDEKMFAGTSVKGFKQINDAAINEANNFLNF